MNADSTNPENKTKDETKKPEDAPKKLDLQNLDLSVEKVEERISPSETNVFDK